MLYMLGFHHVNRGKIHKNIRGLCWSNKVKFRRPYLWRLDLFILLCSASLWWSVVLGACTDWCAWLYWQIIWWNLRTKVLNCCANIYFDRQCKKQAPSTTDHHNVALHRSINRSQRHKYSLLNFTLFVQNKPLMFLCILPLLTWWDPNMYSILWTYL